MLMVRLHEEWGLFGGLVMSFVWEWFSNSGYFICYKCGHREYFDSYEGGGLSLQVHMKCHGEEANL